MVPIITETEAKIVTEAEMLYGDEGRGETEKGTCMECNWDFKIPAVAYDEVAGQQAEGTAPKHSV